MPFRLPIPALGPALLLALLSGCACCKSKVDQALMDHQGPPLPSREAHEHYRVGCPDVLEIEVDGRPDLSGTLVVAVDGRIDVGPLGRVRAEGRTAADLARQVSSQTGLPPEQVRIEVAEFRSQQVYLFGQVEGLERAVDYRGPETVLELLQRTGGISPGAAPRDVHVVRSQIAEGEPPRLYRVNLEAIVMKKDASSNLRLQPFDQVYVGETKAKGVERCIPPCLLPLYKSFCGLHCRRRGTAGTAVARAASACPQRRDSLYPSAARPTDPRSPERGRRSGWQSAQVGREWRWDRRSESERR